MTITFYYELVFFRIIFVLKAMYEIWLWSTQFGYMLNYISIRCKLEEEAKVTHQPAIYMENNAKY